jgi:hypothetical protein
MCGCTGLPFMSLMSLTSFHNYLRCLVRPPFLGVGVFALITFRVLVFFTDVLAAFSRALSAISINASLEKLRSHALMYPSMFRCSVLVLRWHGVSLAYSRFFCAVSSFFSASFCTNSFAVCSKYSFNGTTFFPMARFCLKTASSICGASVAEIPYRIAIMSAAFSSGFFLSKPLLAAVAAAASPCNNVGAIRFLGFTDIVCMYVCYTCIQIFDAVDCYLCYLLQVEGYLMSAISSTTATRFATTTPRFATTMTTTVATTVATT